MKKIAILIIILCLTTSAFANWPFQQEPMLGRMVDKSHQLGDFVGLWLMNEGSGNKVFDLSGNGNVGTFQNDVLWVGGKHGNALYFDGDEDWVDVGDKPTLEGMTQLTIVVGVQPIDASPQQTVVCKPSSWSIEVYSERMRFRTWTGGGEVSTFSTSPSIFDNTYHQIVGVYDGANNYTYVDGVFNISANQTGTIVSNGNKIGIGSYSAAPTTIEYKGIIEYVYVYNRALSALEIVQLYREPFCMFKEDMTVAMMYDYSGAPAPTGQVIMITSAIPILAVSLLWLNRKKAA